MRRDPLAALLPAYEEHGPIFAIRIFHAVHVFMLGPEANRFMLVTDRDKFIWRDGMLGDLIPLIGDGLLTTDGEYHDEARRIMMPAFHRNHVVTPRRRHDRGGRPRDRRVAAGGRVDLYDWARHVAMRVAMRALFGLDPDATGGHDVAHEFERGLSFHGEEFVLQVLRGPGRRSSGSSARRILDRLLGEEIARRRAGDEGDDVLTMLLSRRERRGRCERSPTSRSATRR